MTSAKPPAPLEFKPDLEAADRRFKAFHAGDLIDRPILLVQARRDGAPSLPGTTYHDRVFGDIDMLIDRALEAARWTYYGGESMPQFGTSMGTDECAVFCSDGDFHWNENSGDTNWSKPFVGDWATALPFEINQNHPLWKRMMRLYQRAAERLAGRMLIGNLDLHTNMDLVMSARGAEALCADCIERPEVIDRAMASARAIFPQLWEMMRANGRLGELGYCSGIYSMEGAAHLQCDFSCMISGEMFRRWVIPALEEEASIVKHVVYHWDGPQAMRHIEDLCATRGLYTLSYVPGDGCGGHTKFIELHQRVQQLGKASLAWGSPEEIKVMHRQLKPNMMIYQCWASNVDEAKRLEEWLVNNT